MSFQDWLVEAIEFYRDMGFFAANQDLSNYELASRIREVLAEGSDESQFDPNDPGLDMALLTYDQGRTFMTATCVGARPGLQLFVSAVHQLAGVSRGVFHPESVQERWGANAVRVEFTQDGHKHRVEFPADGDIHEDLFVGINGALLKTGHQFEIAECLHDRSGELLFLTCLSEYERFRVERERGLMFRIFDLGRLFRPLGSLMEEQRFGHYLGTVNEFLDRSVGLLELGVEEGGKVTGGFLYDGTDHREELDFDGHLKGDHLAGSVRGVVSTPGADGVDYTGSWSGTMTPGGSVMFGTWQGWVSDLGEQEPEDKTLVNRGQWATIRSDALETADPHLRRIHKWLREVWTAQDPDHFPWFLPR